MVSSASFLRQLSGKEGWKSSSKRWSKTNYCEGYGESRLKQMEGLSSMCGNMNGLMVMRKRVMVVVDQTSQSKDAMMWALTHITNKADILTLLHILPPNTDTTYHSSCSPNYLAASLGSLCKSCKPEVDIEALVVQGPKLATVMSQVKKLEVSVLVLGQKKSTALLSCICGSSRAEEFVEQCINNVECLSIGVRKQSKGMGGYLISTRWHNNFWLLA
ncbi:hydrolase [Lithospermum erythrorhizon]|uniref:Hydrolase n=1 Tax=Lithospermum erythrorhizon TaxID=34254 RepID=A0AAV3RJR5_LITER